jgi:hypothetical protein
VDLVESKKSNGEGELTVIESITDFWSNPSKLKFITTNGVVNPSGRAVMGKGIALEAAQRIKGIDQSLGVAIATNGNHVNFLGLVNSVYYFSFPTKHFWKDKSDLELVRRSIGEMFNIWSVMGKEQPGLSVCIPRPGCGNGGLDWDKQVRPLMSFLPDSFTVVCLPF